MYTGGRQNFYEIQSHCLRTGGLFEDPEFPPTEDSIGRGGGGGGGEGIRWKRPFELTPTPKFFSDGVSRFDVIQGELGNCWFIAAVTNLTLHPNLFHQVVPQDNTFERGRGYCGAFHFRFWIFGHWIEIVVDDRLPCSSRGRLLFMQSQDKSEFWSSLLEKAYAKLHGSYGSLDGGIPSEALQDFSGGIIEILEVQGNPELFRLLKRSADRGSLMSCHMFRERDGGSGRREQRTSSGLVRGHAYSITGVVEVPLYAGVQLVQLLRLRNPWGSFEWNGPWADKSPEWGMVAPEVKARLGIAVRNDGEFWMRVEDFQERFHQLELVHLSPDPVSEGGGVGVGVLPWKRTVWGGSWIPGQSAGGCPNNQETYATNPQYFLEFEASDVDGEADKCTVVVSLVQRTGSRKFERARRTCCIGFHIYKAKRPGSAERLDSEYLRRKVNLVGSSGTYVDGVREISGRFELPSGTYCIIPSTYEGGVGGDFLLRIFSEPPPLHRQPQQPQHYFPSNNWAPNGPQQGVRAFVPTLPSYGAQPSPGHCVGGSPGAVVTAPPPPTAAPAYGWKL